jgi:hypothetical protein
MATHVQRVQTICDALINNIATSAQINHLGRDLAFQAGVLSEYNAMTNTQKAEFFIQRIRKILIQLVKHYDEYVAAQTAVSNVGASVDAEFIETP